jgi:hypothetical protein
MDNRAFDGIVAQTAETLATSYQIQLRAQHAVIDAQHTIASTKSILQASYELLHRLEAADGNRQGDNHIRELKRTVEELDPVRS